MTLHEITSRRRPAAFAAATLALLLMAGCGADDDAATSEHDAEHGEHAPGAGDADHAAGGQHDHAGMDHAGGGGMEMDEETMERHAEEAHEAADRLRQHARDFADLSPEEQHDRMAEHVSLLAEVFRMVDRQTAEMTGGMPMDHDAMAERMGMSEEEHRRMREGFEDVRSEAGALQTAPVEELQERMSSHLGRLDAMADELDTMAMGHHAHPDQDGHNHHESDEHDGSHEKPAPGGEHSHD